jgi:hypothetical protein
MSAGHASVHARIARVVLALLIIVGAVAVDAALLGGRAVSSDVAAADSDLTLVTDAHYVVQPAQHRIRISVSATATNHKRDTRTRRFYFDRAYLAVQPGTKSFAVVSPKGAKVRVARRTSQYTLLRVDFGRRLYSGKRLALRFRFDLPDPGGAATRPIRIGDAIAAFPIWAYASDGARGSSVSVVFPKDYAVTLERGSLQRTKLSDGRTMLRSGSIPKPTTFFAYVVGDRPGALADTAVDASIDGTRVPLTLRAWADDPAWTKRIGSLMRQGLPAMAGEIGQPWPWTEPIVIAEGTSRTADADAGRFDPAGQQIEIAYFADSYIALHSAAHSWFNGSVLADRWANEAFASFYAQRAMTKLKVKAPMPKLTDAVAKARVPLNAWGLTGEDPVVDDYGYAASLGLAQKIAQRAGIDGLQKVWAAVEAGTLAYQSPVPREERPAAETADAAPDWRGFLDVLEEQTGKPFDDLWRDWVVRPEEAALLDARAATRDSYARTLALAGDWAIPATAREAMRAWQFDAAERILSDTRTVIAQREALEAAASHSGLEVPPTMRTLFETEGSLTEASQEAGRELAIISTLDSVAKGRPPADDPITNLGLIGAHPERSLAEARAAFEEGRLDDATAAAQAAVTGWDGAWAEGRRRLLVVLALLASAFVLGTAIFSTIRRRRPDTASSPSMG